MRLLMVTDAARILGKSSETVRYYQSTGKLPAMKTANGRRLFREDDVKELARTMASKNEVCK